MCNLWSPGWNLEHGRGSRNACHCDEQTCHTRVVHAHDCCSRLDVPRSQSIWNERNHNEEKRTWSGVSEVCLQTCRFQTYTRSRQDLRTTFVRMTFDSRSTWCSKQELSSSQLKSVSDIKNSTEARDSIFGKPMSRESPDIVPLLKKFPKRGVVRVT